MGEFLFIPSAYRVGALAAIKPNTDVGDFDYLRSGAATRVNQNGLVEVVLANVPQIDYSHLIDPNGIARVNLITHSHQFDNASWSRASGASIMANSFTAPDGTMTADTLSFSSSVGSRIQDAIISLPSGMYTFSFWARSVDSSTLDIGVRTGFPASVIETISIDGDWRRYSITQMNNSTSNGNPQIRSVNSDSDNIYIWGAQFETGTVATDYIPTSGGVGIVGAPLLAGAPQLLSERSSRNLFPNSNRGNYGNPPGMELRADGIISGIQAYVPVPDSISEYQFTLLSADISSGDTYTYSWYAKALTTPTGLTREGYLNFRDTSNISSVTVTRIESNINGFDRFQAVFSVIDGSVNAIIRGNFSDIIGVGNQSVAYDGHQLEEGDTATSLISTLGGALTRGLPTVDDAGDTNVYNSSEGTLMFRGSSFGDAGTRLVSLAGSASNAIYVGFSSTLNRIISRYIVDGDLSRIITTFVPDSRIEAIYAVRYTETAFSLWVNGVMIDEIEITNPFLANTLNEFALNRGGSGLNFEGRISQVRYFGRALSDDEMNKLGTL